jgi:hypothetical protein
LGKVIDSESALTFCTGIQEGLSANYPFTAFDSLLVTAALLDKASAPTRKSFNPYPRCFPNKDDRAIIQAHLSVDTVTESPKPTTDLKDADSLFLFACYFTKSDDCGPVAGLRDRLRELLAKEVQIGPLEGVTIPSLILPAGSSRTLPREEFMNRFDGAFSRYKEVSGAKGWFHVRETPEGELLRVTLGLDADGKVASILMRRPGAP